MISLETIHPIRVRGWVEPRDLKPGAAGLLVVEVEVASAPDLMAMFGSDGGRLELVLENTEGVSVGPVRYPTKPAQPLRITAPVTVDEHVSSGLHKIRGRVGYAGRCGAGWLGIRTCEFEAEVAVER